MTTPDSSLASGLLRTLRLEERIKTFVSLDLDPAEEPWEETEIQAICDVFCTSIGSRHPEDNDYEFAQRSGRILVPRMTGNELLNRQLSASRGHLVPQEKPFSSEGVYKCLEPAVPGLLNSLVFKENDEALDANTPWTEDLVEITPQAFGLGLQDVLAATGELKGEQKGFECAGYISRAGSRVPQHLKVGDRVCAIIPSGNWASKVRTSWATVVPVPSEMSLETAASLPVDFAVSFYSLVNLAHLECGDRVLIHSAAGGLGQAAITIAQYLEADIFITVTSDKERRLLAEEYSVPHDRILSYGDATFSSTIMRATEGHGVDVVLDCSLSKQTPRMNPDCVAPFGHFIELSVQDDDDKRPGSDSSSRSMTYSVVDIGKLGRLKTKTLSRNVQQAINLIQQKRLVHRIPITRFSVSDCDKAFGLMHSGSLVGKIVVTVTEGDPIKVISPPEPVNLDASAAYLIVGGLGGLGLEVAHWMAQRGAKNLILVSRSAERYNTDAFRGGFKDLRSQIFVRNCDISSKHDLEEIVNEYRKRWPLRGVIQAATVLQDSLFGKMTSEQWNTSMLAKYRGTKNLDELFQGSDVDFFIILSSLTAVVGNVGQANYTAASAYQDALVYSRVARGLPAVSINIGSVPDLGSALRTGMAEQIDRMGCRYQKRSELIRLVELAIRYPRQQQMITGIKPWAEPENLRWRQEPRFGFTRLPNTQDRSKRQRGAKVSSVKDRLIGVSDEAANNVLVEVLREQLAGMTAFSASDIDPDEQLLTYGVDSLVAVEFRALLQANVTLGVTIFDIIQSVSLRDLAIKVKERISEESV
ncbi:Squalestatin tetraketide synthase [Cladobotryum mycophilum]|uniref:Squalestatin tetraketide synthase n=1 Tax=Cladobotryum mycophilum TaxID=491253 RepID=A0ABR0S7I0_9HYPO